MTNREVHQFDDRKQTSLAAAQAMVSLAAQAIKARGRFVVALSGGSTPCDLHRALTKAECRERFDWNRVE